MDRLANFIMSLSVVTFVLVYVVDLPTLLTGETKLVTEYYYKDFAKSFLLDIVVVGVYLVVGESIASALQLKSEVSHITCIVLTAGVISSLFYLLFSSGWRKGSFFHRWFAAVGVKAIGYDMILVGSVYSTMLVLDRLIARRLA